MARYTVETLQLSGEYVFTKCPGLTSGIKAKTAACALSKQYGTVTRALDNGKVIASFGDHTKWNELILEQAEKNELAWQIVNRSAQP